MVTTLATARAMKKTSLCRRSVLYKKKKKKSLSSFKRFQKKFNAATIIQCAWRSFQSRRKLRRLKPKRKILGRRKRAAINRDKRKTENHKNKYNLEKENMGKNEHKNGNKNRGKNQGKGGKFVVPSYSESGIENMKQYEIVCSFYRAVMNRKNDNRSWEDIVKLVIRR